MKTETEHDVYCERIPKNRREMDAENGIIRKGELARIDYPFYFPVGNDDDMPNQPLEVGKKIVFYTHAAVVENWYSNRITLINPAVGAGEFIVKRSARILADGKYVNLHFADILELDEQTAIGLMKGGIVDPVDPKSWRP